MNRFDPKGHLQPDYATLTNSSDSNPFIVNPHLPNDIHVELLVPFGSLCRNSMKNAITIVVPLRLYRIPVLLPVDSEPCAPSF